MVFQAQRRGLTVDQCGMRPRPVIPGKTYFITRRIVDRQFFLRPGEELNAIFIYELARAASLYGVKVHGYVAMSNHIHLLVTDELGLLPYFMHCLSLQVAKAGSALIGRWGGFWARGRYSRVEVLDGHSMVEKLSYVLANPTAAGLVRRAHRWPGATSIALKFGDTVVAPRPTTSFYKRSTKPQEVAMTLVAPPHVDAVECYRSVVQEVRRIEKETAARLLAENRKFVGERRVLQQNPYDSPSSWEKRRGLNPTFASKDKWTRIEAAQCKHAWESEYEQALVRFNDGERDVEFPAGTWAMVQRHNCRCSPICAQLAA